MRICATVKCNSSGIHFPAGDGVRFQCNTVSNAGQEKPSTTNSGQPVCRPWYPLFDMGGGVSSLSRLRKAIVIRAYNLRKPDETLDDQFRRFAVRDVDGVLYISFDNIKRCLLMETKEYDWVDMFLQHSFGTEVSTRVQCSAARLCDYSGVA
jgi:hypothetical protein